MDIIRTRLRPPTRGTGLIERPKLDSEVERICHRRLVFVMAPAGYGKSSLLHRWYIALGARGVVAGWLSMDQSQDDLRSFILYATEAIRAQMPGFGANVLDFLEHVREPTEERVATAFLEALLAHDDHIVLFIDDFQLLSDSGAIWTVEIMLRDAPPNFHLVLASRQALAFSLARLRMLGEADEFGTERLRFDADDLGKFLRLSHSEPLNEQEAGSLLAVTEGWPAGIQLALISLSNHEHLQSFLDRFSGEHRAVSEFLVTDVIDNLPAGTVDFLLKTSVLEMFNDELCNIVAGTRDAKARIADLSRRNLFIFSLDDENRWYRYHHLFAEVLKRMLRDRMPEQLTSIHRRASGWFAEHGYAELALNHAIMADDWTGAGRILDSNCTDLFYQGKRAVLERYARMLPPGVLDRFPRVQLELAWSIILEWRFDDARAIIRRVERALEEAGPGNADPERATEVQRVVLHRRMMLSLFMDDPDTLERSVLELMHDFPSDDPYLRGSLENCLIYACREKFRLDHVDRMDRRARDFFERSGSKFVFVWHESIVAPTYHLRGDTQAAENSLRSAIAIAEYVEGPSTPLQAMPAMLLAEILYEKNDISGARDLVDRFGELALQSGFVDNLAACFVTRIRLCMRDGDFDEAAALIAEGHACAEFHGFARLRQRLWVESVRLAQRRGDLNYLRGQFAANRTRTRQATLVPGDRTTGKDEFFVLGWALLACQANRAREAADVLQRWASFAGRRRTLRSQVRFLIALADALFLAGERGEALRTLRSAVQKAAAPDYVSSFVDAGAPIHTLLRELFDTSANPTGPVSAFGQRLLEAFAGQGIAEKADARPVADVSSDTDLAPPVTLNERERDILRLVSHGKSNKDVARVLGMTEGTIKWYMQQIFTKLDVRRRTLAVQRARQFGLL